jgi:hypothetical protein
VKKDGKWGYVDRSGAYKIKAQFEKADSFRQGIARAKSGGKWGLIKIDGSWLESPTHSAVDEIEGGWYVRDGKAWGLIQANGQWLVKPRMAKRLEYHGGLARQKDPNTKLWGYVNLTGNWAIPAAFSRAGDFSLGYARVKDQGSAWLLIDSRGKTQAVSAAQDPDRGDGAE